MALLIDDRMPNLRGSPHLFQVKPPRAGTAASKVRFLELDIFNMFTEAERE